MSDWKVRRLLQDLGKATQRGVRKCPKCLTCNGTRGRICKNKDCNHVFKPPAGGGGGGGGEGGGGSESSPVDQPPTESEAGSSGSRKYTKNGLDAIRLITGSSTMNIYSVRVRDRGPDYRGFVEVPIIQGLEGAADPSLDASFIAETTARCLVDVCKKVNLPIDEAISSTFSTQVASLAFGSSSSPSSTSCSSSNQIETSITLSLTEPCLHIKECVKCSVDATPLTFKCSLLTQLGISSEAREEIWTLIEESPPGSSLVQRVSRTNVVVRCKPTPKRPSGHLHCSFGESPSTPGPSSFNRFACSCKAFKKLRNIPQGLKESEPLDKATESGLKKCIHYYISIVAFASDSELCREFKSYISTELPQINVDNQLTTSTLVGQRCDPDNGLYVAQVLLKQKKEQDSTANTRKLIDRGVLTEADISVPFVDWLSSATELINRTMHYQLNGRPDPLLFRIPQLYFDCLLQRIASGTKKKRLPNVTTVFTRRDCPPFGTFTKYTYLITSLQQVKHIFTTDQVPLETTQRFTQSRDGTFDYLFLSPAPDAQTYGSHAYSATSNCLIKPSEMKTCLKVSDDPKEGTPFVIEWIPDVLPRSKVGELRLQFTFGHIKNGNLFRRE